VPGSRASVEPAPIPRRPRRAHEPLIIGHGRPAGWHRCWPIGCGQTHSAHATGATRLSKARLCGGRSTSWRSLKNARSGLEDPFTDWRARQCLDALRRDLKFRDCAHKKRPAEGDGARLSTSLARPTSLGAGGRSDRGGTKRLRGKCHHKTWGKCLLGGRLRGGSDARLARAGTMEPTAR